MSVDNLKPDTYHIRISHPTATKNRKQQVLLGYLSLLLNFYAISKKSYNHTIKEEMVHDK